MILKAFNSRSNETERLDRGEFSNAEYQRWQNEMWYIHRFFGEVRALRKSLVAEIDGANETALSVLEIAAGSGGLLTYLERRFRRKDLTLIGLEISADSALSIADKGNLAIRGDGLAPPFADKSIDFVFTTLFVHHLEEHDAARLMHEMDRVARRKFFIIDLDRRAIPYFLYKGFGSFFLQPFTRHDGALSIKRAYRANELEGIARTAGLKRFKVQRSAINRLILVGGGE